MKTFWLVLLLAVITAYGSVPNLACRDDSDCPESFACNCCGVCAKKCLNEYDYCPGKQECSIHNMCVDPDCDLHDNCIVYKLEEVEKEEEEEDFHPKFVSNKKRLTGCTHDPSCPNGHTCFFGRCSTDPWGRNNTGK